MLPLLRMLVYVPPDEPDHGIPWLHHSFLLPITCCVLSVIVPFIQLSKLEPIKMSMFSSRGTEDPIIVNSSVVRAIRMF